MGKRWTVESLYANLDALGESEVRYRLDAQTFGTKGSEKYLLVQKWLFEREQAARAARDAEDLAIAKAASDAARDAADEAQQQTGLAREANTIAKIALAIAAIALIVATVAMCQDANPAVSPSSPAPSASEP
jgi:hypothetical protein